MNLHANLIRPLKEMFHSPPSRRHWLGLAAVLVASGPAAAIDLGPLRQISGPSPFSSCTADQVGSQEGTNYPQSEIEPWIDANPSNARNLIAGWQQDRWSNGGSRGDVSAYTKDAGVTWHTVLVPNTTACTGGTYKRASDPWISISPNGTAYFMSLVFDPDLPNGAFGPNAMLVNRSTDGGETWGNPIALIEEPAGQVLHDKNSLTADPTSSRFAYAVWDRLQDFTLPPGPIVARSSVAVARTAGGTGDGVVGARQRARQLHSQAPAAAGAAGSSCSRRLRSSLKARSISPARPTSGRLGRRRASSTIPAATLRRSTT